MYIWQSSSRCVCLQGSETHSNYFHQKVEIIERIEKDQSQLWIPSWSTSAVNNFWSQCGIFGNINKNCNNHKKNQHMINSRIWARSWILWKFRGGWFWTGAFVRMWGRPESLNDQEGVMGSTREEMKWPQPKGWKGAKYIPRTIIIPVCPVGESGKLAETLSWNQIDKGLEEVLTST